MRYLVGTIFFLQIHPLLFNGVHECAWTNPQKNGSNDLPRGVIAKLLFPRVKDYSKESIFSIDFLRFNQLGNALSAGIDYNVSRSWCPLVCCWDTNAWGI